MLDPDGFIAEEQEVTFMVKDNGIYAPEDRNIQGEYLYNLLEDLAPSLGYKVVKKILSHLMSMKQTRPL